MSRFLPYVVAVMAVAVALGIRLLLNPWMGANRPFLLFVAAVAVSAWFGGTRRRDLFRGAGLSGRELCF